MILVRSTGKGSYLQLGDGEDALVVGDGAHDDGDLAFSAFVFHQSGHTRDRNGGTINAGHEQTTQDDLVELGIRSTGQESVQLE